MVTKYKCIKMNFLRFVGTLPPTYFLTACPEVEYKSYFLISDYFIIITYSD